MSLVYIQIPTPVNKSFTHALIYWALLMISFDEKTSPLLLPNSLWICLILWYPANVSHERKREREFNWTLHRVRTFVGIVYGQLYYPVKHFTFIIHTWALYTEMHNILLKAHKIMGNMRILRTYYGEGGLKLGWFLAWKKVVDCNNLPNNNNLWQQQ